MNEISNDPQKHLENLSEIRSLMEKSSRFLSLSGLSGVWAGGCALVGAWFASQKINSIALGKRDFWVLQEVFQNPREADQTVQFFFFLALAVLFSAVVGSVFFTFRKAKRLGTPVFSNISKRFLLNFSLPLLVGFIFSLALIKYGLVGLIAPAMLIFYGLALTSAAKFTVRDIYFVGILEILLGIFGLFNIGIGLYLWTIGFGLLHILYGTIMWWKYDR